MGVALLQPMPKASTMDVINFNLILGVARLVVMSGLLLMARWGYWEAFGVSVPTIIFEGISAPAVSSTALAGLVLPVVFLGTLFSRRSKAGLRSTDSACGLAPVSQASTCSRPVVKSTLRLCHLPSSSKKGSLTITIESRPYFGSAQSVVLVLGRTEQPHTWSVASRRSTSPECL